MAGYFIYQPQAYPGGVGAQTSVNRFRQFLSFATGHTVKHLGEVVPASTSGNYSITGIGFQPDALLVFCYGANVDILNVDGMEIAVGAATSPAARWSVSMSSDFGDIGTRTRAVANDKLIYLPVTKTSADPYYYSFACDLVSFDADGFTINVTTSSPIDVRIMGLALQHTGPQFACGTAQVPGGTGTQAITGLGFQPQVVLFASSQMDTLGSVADGVYQMVGAADYLNGSWSIWSGGSGPSDPYIDMTATDGSPLTMWLDADGAGPFDPIILSQASLQSFDADGFTLNWTTVDGLSRYWHWFAIADDVEAGRINFDSGNGIQRVFTRKGPQGLWFFMNDMGVNDLGTSPGQGGDHNTETYGVSYGFGACGPQPGLVQSSVSGGVTAEHTFPFAELSSRYGNVGLCMGAGGRGNQGILGESPGPNDYAKIIRLSSRRDHLLRMHVGQ